MAPSDFSLCPCALFFVCSSRVVGDEFLTSFMAGFTSFFYHYQLCSMRVNCFLYLTYFRFYLCFILSHVFVSRLFVSRVFVAVFLLNSFIFDHFTFMNCFCFRILYYLCSSVLGVSAFEGC